MEIINRQKRDDGHPYIPELQDRYQQGRISRREFLRNATLLGMSFAGASAFLAACGPAAEPTPVPEPTKPPEPTATPVPAGPTRGGTLTLASRVHKLAHLSQPAHWRP